MKGKHGWRVRNCNLLASTAILAVHLAGCATYIPVEIEPAVLAADFQARSLNDPRLHALMAAAASDVAAEAEQGWNLTALTLAALYYHPDLQVSRAKILQAEAAVLTAGQIPNPELNATATLHSITTPSPWTVGALINFLLETGGRRQLRIEQADRLADAARLELTAASWLVRGRVRSAMITLWSAQTKVRLLAKRKDFQAELVDILERQLVAGQVTALIISRERSVLSQIRLSVEDANRQAAEARVGLATAIGLSVAALQKTKLSFGVFENPPRRKASMASTDFRREAIQGRSDLRVLLAGYDAAAAGVRLEIAKQFPTIKLGPGYTYDKTDNLYSLGFSTDLPIFNRNEGQIAEADAKRIEVGTRFNALQAQIVGEVDMATASYGASSRSLATADVLHASERERQKNTARAFAAGEIDRQALLTGELELTAIEVGRLDILVQNLNSIGLLEDALRRPLFASDVLSSLPIGSGHFRSAVLQRQGHQLKRD